MWSLYLGYNGATVIYIFVMWEAYLFRAYANNVKCMHTSHPGHIVEFGEFI